MPLLLKQQSRLQEIYNVMCHAYIRINHTNHKNWTPTTLTRKLDQRGLIEQATAAWMIAAWYIQAFSGFGRLTYYGKT